MKKQEDDADSEHTFSFKPKDLEDSSDDVATTLKAKEAWEKAKMKKMQRDERDGYGNSES